jgi:hypothetical protein
MLVRALGETRCKQCGVTRAVAGVASSARDGELAAEVGAALERRFGTASGSYPDPTVL